MLVFLNGKFVPEEQATISVFDRSFLYGDGLFETMRVANGVPFRWEQHLERLARGASFLKIKIPFTEKELRCFADKLITDNKMPEALLRVTLSRGVGIRGYSPKGAENAVCVMSLHGTAGTDGVVPAWRLVTASFRLPAQEPLAQFKTCNKLPQIMARCEADTAAADEALLLNTDGKIVEASSSNLFWILKGAVCTSPLASGILAGVTRAVVLEICRTKGAATREAELTRDQLAGADAVFLSLSSVGIAEGISLDGQKLRRSPVVNELYEAYWQLVTKETAR